MTVFGTHVVCFVCCVVVSVRGTQPPFAQVSELVRTAQRAEQAGNFEEAEGLYRDVLKVRPHWVPAEFRLALLYQSQKKYPEAISLLTDIVTHDPRMADAYLLRGEGYYEIDQYRKALASLQQAIRLRPKDAEAWFYVGASHYQLHDYKRSALAYLEQARLQPRQGKTYFQLVQCYDALRNVIISQINRNKSASYFVLLLEAEKDSQHHDDVAADVQIEAAIATDLHAPEAWFIKAGQEEQSKLSEAAKADFERALQANAKDSPKFTSIIDNEMRTHAHCVQAADLATALCRISNGNLAGATNSVFAAVEEAPDDVRTLYWATRIYGRLIQRAIAKVAEVSPDSPDLQKLYARAFDENGQRAEAARRYEQAIALDDHDASSLIEYANFRSEAQEFEQAIALLKKALTLTPYDYNVEILLAQAYVHKGEPAPAVPYLADVLRIAPGNSQLRIDLAESLHSASRTSEAIAVLESAPDDPDGRVSYVLARFYALEGEADKARVAREAFLSKQRQANQTVK